MSDGPLRTRRSLPLRVHELEERQPSRGSYAGDERRSQRLATTTDGRAASGVSPQSADVSEFEDTTLGISFIGLANGPEAVGQ